MKIYDISRSVSKEEPIYPGNLGVKLISLKKYKKDGSTLSGIEFGLHAGSHLDAPPHYTKSSQTVDRIDLQQTLGWCRVVDFSKLKAGQITAKEINRVQAKVGEIILLKTKNSETKLRKFNKKFVHIEETAAKAIVKSGIKAIGIDGPSIRKFGLRPDTVHPLLLKNKILIYEGLYLKDIPPGRYYFFGLPIKIVGAEASPVRAILIKT